MGSNIDSTDEAGQAEIEITASPMGQFWRIGTTGYYRVRAVELGTGFTIGEWGSVPINDGQAQGLILEVGKEAEFFTPILKENPGGNFILYVSNQGSMKDPADITIYIDGKMAVDQEDFYVKDQCHEDKTVRRSTFCVRCGVVLA